LGESHDSGQTKTPFLRERSGFFYFEELKSKKLLKQEMKALLEISKYDLFELFFSFLWK
jgi:hypothetical protein